MFEEKKSNVGYYQMDINQIQEIIRREVARETASLRQEYNTLKEECDSLKRQLDSVTSEIKEDLKEPLSREHKPREHKPREHKPREHRPRRDPLSYLTGKARKNYKKQQRKKQREKQMKQLKTAVKRKDKALQKIYQFANKVSAKTRRNRRKKEKKRQKRLEAQRKAKLKQEAIPFYTIKQESSRYSKKFKTNEKRTSLLFNNNKLRTLNSFEDVWRIIIKALREVIALSTQGVDPRFLMLVNVRYSADTNNWATNLRGYTPIKDFDIDAWLDSMLAKMESWYHRDLSEELFFSVKVVEKIKGAGSHAKKAKNLGEFLKKKSIIKINNEDNLCLYRATLVALARHYQKDKDFTMNIDFGGEEVNLTKYFYDKVRRSDRKHQTKYAQLLATDAGFDYEEAGRCGVIPCVDEINALNQHLGCLANIVIYQGNSIVYKGDEKAFENGIPNIYLHKLGNHFDTITNIKGFLGFDRYCEKCLKGYSCKQSHPCDVSSHKCNICDCKGVNHYDKRGKYQKWLECEDCNRRFPTQECFDYHKMYLVKQDDEVTNKCEQMYKCLKCGGSFKTKNITREAHKCGHAECTICHEYVEIDSHLCTMQKHNYATDEDYQKRIDKDNKRTFYYYDFEAMQNKKDDQGNLIHEVNYGIIQSSKNKTHIIHTIEEFCEFMLHKDRKGGVFIAHNMRGYDGHFILKYCLQFSHRPFTIENGCKIMYMNIQANDVKLIDSLSFFGCPLSKLPKMFGLKELKKGYFPHWFNLPENQNYVGPLPDIKYYKPDIMKEEDREKFLSWHKEHKEHKEHANDVFDFKKEMHDYCLSDVQILKQACEAFTTSFKEITGVEWSPFHNVTIASSCMRAAKEKFLNVDDIAVLSNKDEVQDIHSRESIVWLRSLKHASRIIHGNKGREYVIKTTNNSEGKNQKNYKVDGYDPKTKTVYEFQGCYFHGCTKCYEPCKLNHLNNKKMYELLKDTNNKVSALEKAGYKVVQMWEHDWNNKLAKDKALSKRCNEYRKQYERRLIPREAFMGGHTEAFTLYHKAKKGEKIRYVDFTSLYPYINKYGWYPVGHPTIIYQPNKEEWLTDENTVSYKGIIKCKVVPPRGLYHPVLPVKTKSRFGTADKLMKSLCRTCSQEKKNSTKCRHTDEERSFIGTWTHWEINKALEKGYLLEHIYEAHHFDKWKQGLMKNYVNVFLKVKQECSDWPDWVETEEDKNRYLSDYLKYEGIQLDKENIRKNPGMRSVAKLCLNSLWGKFGQSNCMPQTVYIDNYADYMKYLTSPEFCNQDATILGELVMISYNTKKEHIKTNTSTNIYVALMTTAQARMKLYNDLLDPLQKKALYCDTDSCIFVDDGTTFVPLGDYLGELTNELDKDDYITEFVTTGAKSYAYRTKNGKVCCKIKGFTLNYKNGKKLNMKTMIDLLENPQSSVEIKDNLIRTSKDHTVITKECSKKFSFEYDKRSLDLKESYQSLPWGY